MFYKASRVVSVGCFSDAVGKSSKVIAGFNYEHK